MNIQLFGVTREIVGRNQLLVPEHAGIKTVADLKSWLNAQYPAMEQLNSLAIAVDHTFAGDEEELHSGQEVALIPPVSGG